MTYDLDNPGRGVRECPRCKFTMERLRHSRVLDRQEGYLLDTSVGWSPDDHIVTASLFGSVWHFLWRHVLEPLSYKLFGDWRKRRYAHIVRAYPESLICPHCGYLLRRR
jgi:hypothetical protein